MLLLMAIAAVICVVQLAILGSPARSLRLTTLMMTIGVGFYFCGTIAVLLQFGWTRLVSATTGASLRQLVETASYTADPVIEEVVKLLPLMLLGWWWTSSRRQLGLTDHLLIGAGLGVGFELFEAALRYSSLGRLVLGVPGGYLVSGSLGGTVTVPSPWHSLTSWQPAPAAFQALLASGGDTVQHLVWTALAALGLGWVARRRGWLRWLGLIGLLVACLDHANYNLRAANSVPVSLDAASDALSWVGGTLPELLVIALAAAVVADRWMLSRSRAVHPDLLLAGEPSVLGGGPLLGRALVAVPWSTYTAWRFVLARRAVLFACATGTDEPELRASIAQDRALLERANSLPAWSAAGHRFTQGLRQALALRRLLASPVTVLWLVTLIPAVLYLVIGGLPATSGLQRWLRGPVGLGLLVATGVAGAILLVLQMRAARTALGALPPLVLHEARIRPQERILTGAGGLIAVVPMIMLAIATHTGDRRVVENYHALDALSQAFMIGGLALFVASLFFFPPFALAMTTAGVPILVSTITSELLVAGALSGVLAGTGVMLNEAAENAGTESGGGSSGSSDAAAAAREQRIQELARDPAHGGRITPASRAEAEVGAGLEESGQVQGLQRSTREAEEFVDGQRNAWDVKGFHSEKGRFNLDSAMRSIWKEMNWSQENVMLDTRNLSPGDLAQLRQAVEAATARGELPLRVLWWP